MSPNIFPKNEATKCYLDRFWKKIRIVHIRYKNEEIALNGKVIEDIIFISQLKFVRNNVALFGNEIIPVIDLRSTVCMTDPVQAKKSRVLVASFTERTVGILVDQVIDDYLAYPVNIEKLPSEGGQINFVLGKITKPNKAVMVIDLARFLKPGLDNTAFGQ